MSDEPTSTFWAFCGRLVTQKWFGYLVAAVVIGAFFSVGYTTIEGTVLKLWSMTTGKPVPGCECP
jgi:hypothetical protein